MFIFILCFFFFKQKTAYEMRISDWSSDVCSSDLDRDLHIFIARTARQANDAVHQLEVRLSEGGEAAKFRRRHPGAIGRDQPLFGFVPQRVEAPSERSLLEPGNGSFSAQLAADSSASLWRLGEHSATGTAGLT